MESYAFRASKPVRARDPSGRVMTSPNSSLPSSALPLKFLSNTRNASVLSIHRVNSWKPLAFRSKNAAFFSSTLPSRFKSRTNGSRRVGVAPASRQG